MFLGLLSWSCHLCGHVVAISERLFKILLMSFALIMFNLSVRQRLHGPCKSLQVFAFFRMLHLMVGVRCFDFSSQ